PEGHASRRRSASSSGAVGRNRGRSRAGPSLGPAHAMMKTVALAAAIGLAATLVALGVLALGGAGLIALDWSVYDRWLRARESAPASAALVVVVREHRPCDEARAPIVAGALQGFPSISGSTAAHRIAARPHPLRERRRTHAHPG